MPDGAALGVSDVFRARSAERGIRLRCDRVYGAKHVLISDRATRSGLGNIGAVKIPRDRVSLGALAAKLREFPTEVSSGSWTKPWRAIEKLRARFFPRR